MKTEKAFLLAAALAAGILRASAASTEAVAAQPVALDDVVILGSRIESNPAGRTIGRVERKELEKRDAFSLRDVMDSVPGVFVKPSNGPRDVNISIRGSGAKTSFAVRNIKMYEDWFPTTQSDGLSRTDINDPNAYEGVDVLRGPSSALYDNYALGGVVNFRTRRGRDLDGWNTGASAGSYGYQNFYVHTGAKTEKFEYALFGSLVRGDGYISHSGFRTATENFTAVFTPDDHRTVTFKFLNNDLTNDFPSRLSKADYDANSRGAGKTAITGGATVTAQQAAQGRDDRRTIVGARYEEFLTPETGLRVLGEYDVKDINQTGGTIGDNVNPNFHHYADITHEGYFLGLPAKHYAGVFFNYMEQEANSFRNLADYQGTRGALQSNTRGYHRNLGGRLREELKFSDRWSGILGLGLERSKVRAAVQTRSNTVAEAYSRVSVDRAFFNMAPEASVVYSPSAVIKAHARAAMGYGIPGIGQLTTTPDGLTGNNTSLKAQRNLGFELGAAGEARGMFSYDATVFDEFFYDELVTQFPGAGSSFTSNAPRSEHRGVELWAQARHNLGLFLNGAYTLNDQVYKRFSETIGAGVTLDRSGKQIPGVERQILALKAGFDKKGLPGGWLELNHVGSFNVNNSNTLKADPYTIFNANLNYSLERPVGGFRKVTLFCDVHNIANRKYQASAIPVSDTPADTAATLLTGKQSFFAGQGRSFVVGVKLEF